MSLFNNIDYKLFLDFASNYSFDKFNYFIHREVITTYKISDGVISYYSTPFSYLDLSYIKDDYYDIVRVSSNTILVSNLFKNLQDNFILDRNEIPTSLYSNFLNKNTNENRLAKEFNFYKQLVDLLYKKLKANKYIKNINLVLDFNSFKYNSFSNSYNSSSYFVLPLLSIDLIFVKGIDIRVYYDEFNLCDFDIDLFLNKLDGIITSRFNMKKFETGFYDVLFTPKSFALLLSRSNIFFNGDIRFKAPLNLNIKHVTRLASLNANYNILEDFYLVKNGKFLDTATSYFLKKYNVDSANYSCNLFIEPCSKINFNDGLIITEFDIKHTPNVIWDDELVLSCYGIYNNDPCYFYIHTSFKEIFEHIISIGDDLYEYYFNLEYEPSLFVSTPSILVSNLKVYNSYDFSSLDIF